MSKKSIKVPLLIDKGNTAEEESYGETGAENGSCEPGGENCESNFSGGSDGEKVTTTVKQYGSFGYERQAVQKTKASWFVLWLTFLAACGSFLFGYDTGIVSGAMLYLREEFALTELQQEAVVSVTIGAAAVFSLVGGVLNHAIGRKPTIIIASVTFTIGAVVLGFAVNLAMLIIGRLILGIGIGLSSMTVPMYVAECSPPASRGSLVTVHQLMITIGILIASLCAGAFSYMENGWRYMLGLAAVPSAFQLVAFSFMPESPRWLVSAGKLKKAEAVLMRIRLSEHVSAELTAIQEDTCHSDSIGSTFGVLGQMFRSKPVRRALIIGCGLQMFQQIAGINTVMYYTATIMKMSGVRDNSQAIWLSCTVAGANVLLTILAVYLIDRVGRKPLVVISFIGVLVGLIILATGFQLAAFHSPGVSKDLSSPDCYPYRDCDSCNASPHCGFCYLDQNTTITNGSCLLAAAAYSENSATGQCSQSERTMLGAIWAYDFCPSDYAWMTLLGMIVYIVSFASGLAPIPWAMNSEIYPLWARSVGNALSTATNWTFNLIIAMTFLTLTTTLTKYGTYWLYSCLAVVGVVFVVVLVPETKGRSLEEMEMVMSRPWLNQPYEELAQCRRLHSASDQSSCKP